MDRYFSPQLQTHEVVEVCAKILYQVSAITSPGILLENLYRHSFRLNDTCKSSFC
jgi:hypothetical protein